MAIRKIIDPKQNGEKVWLKGHAQAIYMSDGSTVEDAINNIDIPSLDEYVTETELNDKGFLTEHQDISHLASKEWVNNNNYATEYDLKNIDYSSINNVPVSEDETGELNITDENGNIGMKIASEAVYGKDFIAGVHKLSEKVDKTYVDNSIAELVDGAPETLDTLNELAAALNDNADIVDVLNQSISNKQDKISDLETIRSGAAKGATALQSYTEQYKGTVTGVKFNGGNAVQPNTNGVVDLGTIVTDANVQAIDTGDVLDDVNVEYATSEYVSNLVGDINTILENIIGGNVVVFNGYREITHGTSDTSITIQPNVLHIWDVVTSLNIELSDEVSGVANEYTFQFKSGNTPTTLSLPDNIKWNNDTIPTIEANKQYQISILKGLASILSTSI